jgi:dTDP-D-glucose 4,6-dehydratase
MDSSKTMKNFAWKLKSNFEDGLEKTIRWYMQNPQILNNITNALESTPWKNSN